MAFSDTPLKWVIHIGAHKTGSTSIQFYCRQHLEADSGGAFLYPANEITPNQSQQEQIVRWLNQGEDALLGEEIARIRARAAETGASHVVISAEGLSLLRPDRIAAFRSMLPADDDYAIVGYFRDSYGYVLSRFKHILRTIGFDEAMKFLGHVERSYNPAANIRGWEAAFGATCVHVFHYESVPNVLEHFLEILGVETEARTDAMSNRSVDFVTALLSSQFVSVRGAAERPELRKAYQRIFAGFDPEAAGTDALLLGLMGDIAINIDHPKLAALDGTRPAIGDVETTADLQAEYWRRLAEFCQWLADR